MSPNLPGTARAAPSLAVWSERHQRAMKLLARRSHAAPLLEFLIDLLEEQRDVFRWAAGHDWLPAVLAPEGEYPRLKLERLPLAGVLQPRFAEFVGRIRNRATEVLATLAGRIEGQNAAEQVALLETYLSRRPLDDLAAARGCETLQLEFFPRAFAQPVAEWLARSLGAPPEQWHEAFCPYCGRLPQLAVLRDEAVIKSRRLFECALCLTQWVFRRSVCPHCGESQSGKLEFHAPEDFPHVRVEECLTCHAYFKTVDLRKNGLAIPMVEEIATVELDLWADERGLWKLQPNLLGL